jgi:hypothetical protein
MGRQILPPTTFPATSTPPCERLSAVVGPATTVRSDGGTDRRIGLLGACVHIRNFSTRTGRLSISLRTYWPIPQETAPLSLNERTR